MEQARRHHTERATIAAELPGARDRQAKARESEATAGSDAAAARAAVDEARVARESAAAALAEARDVGSRLKAEWDALRAVVAPARLDALEGRRTSAVVAHERAAAALACAEQADAAARSALAAAPDRAPLEQARRDHRALVEVGAVHRTARDAADAARAAVAATGARVEGAAAHVEHARARRAAALRADLVAALRPGLVQGAECPVCTQSVTVLPPPLPEGDLAAADHALAAADAALDEARRAEAAATAEHARASAAQQAASDTLERLTAALARVALPPAVMAPTPSAVGPDAGFAAAARRDGAATDTGEPSVFRRGAAGGADPLAGGAAPPDEQAGGGAAQDGDVRKAVPSAAAIEAALVHLDGLAAAARAADEAVRRARAERDAATTEVEAVRAAATAAVTALRSARDPLVGLGAPSVDDADPVAGWATLVAWAAGEADVREAALPAARTRYLEAQDVHGGAEQGLRSAEEAAEQRRREETAAARAEQEATGFVEQLERRGRELAAALREAPADDEAAAALAEIDKLENAVRVADAALRSARAAVRVAEGTATAVEREVVEAWAELRAARDPLAALDAPAVGGDDLVAAWAELVAWARVAAEARAAEIRRAEQTRAAAAARRGEVARRVLDDLATHDVPLDTAALAPSRTGRGPAADGAAQRPGLNASGTADEGVVAAKEGRGCGPRRRRGCGVGCEGRGCVL